MRPSLPIVLMLGLGAATVLLGVMQLAVPQMGQATHTAASNVSSPPTSLEPEPRVPAAILRTEAASPAPESAVTEALPIAIPGEPLDSNGRVRADASALVAAGVAPDVAQEIATAVDAQWSLMQKLSGDEEVMRSLGKAASDILFALVPDLADLIRAQQVEVVASPRQHPKSGSTVGFTVLPDGERVNVRIQGKQQDVVLRLRRQNDRPDAPLWLELKRHLATARLRKQ